MMRATRLPFRSSPFAAAALAAAAICALPEAANAQTPDTTAGYVDAVVGTNAKFKMLLTGIASTADTLYITDAVTCLRSMSLSSGVVITIAGKCYTTDLSAFGYVNAIGTNARFFLNGPLAVDAPTGVVYVADQGYVLRSYDPASGAVATAAGGGNNFAAVDYGNIDAVGTNARFNNINGLAADNAGSIFIASYKSLRKISLATGAVSTLVSGDCTPKTPTGCFDSLKSVAYSAGAVFFMDKSALRSADAATGAVTFIAG